MAGIDAVGAAGGIVEAAVCYTGDVSDPKRAKYNLDYYMDFVQQLVDLDIHVLARSRTLSPNAPEH